MYCSFLVFKRCFHYILRCILTNKWYKRHILVKYGSKRWKGCFWIFATKVLSLKINHIGKMINLLSVYWHGLKLFRFCNLIASSSFRSQFVAFWTFLILLLSQNLNTLILVLFMGRKGRKWSSHLFYEKKNCFPVICLQDIHIFKTKNINIYTCYSSYRKWITIKYCNDPEYPLPHVWTTLTVASWTPL